MQLFKLCLAYISCNDSSMTLKVSCWRKFSKTVPYHSLNYFYIYKMLSVVYTECMTDKFRRNLTVSSPSLYCITGRPHLLSHNFLEQTLIDIRSFFQTSTHNLNKLYFSSFQYMLVTVFFLVACFTNSCSPINGFWTRHSDS